jgi:serine/threonine protein kinase
MRGLFKLTNSDKPLGGRYKVISELGKGGFGQTFLAQDLHMPDHPQCVVKQLKPQQSDAETLQMARRLFDMEARVLYKVGNHDQIPRLLAHFEENQEFFLAQEFIDGEPLTRELKEGPPWSEARVISLLQDLLTVLAFVHEQSVIHRDIKPSNLIRRREDGKIVLIDFGAVKQVSRQVIDQQTGQTKTISIGTQGYTPKEQMGGNPRFSSDIYAVGMIAIQALTTIHPRHLTEDPQTGEIRWQHRAPHISSQLAAFLDCMVRYDFRARYPNAVEALSALRSLMQSMPLSQSLPQEIRELPRQQGESSPSAIAEADSSIEQAPTNIWESSEFSSTVPEATESGIGQAPTNIRVPSEPASAIHEATESGIEQAPTNIWTPSQFPAPVSNLESTPSSQSQRSQTPWTPTAIRSGGIWRKPIIIGSALAGLVAVSATFFLTKVFPSAPFTNQTTDRLKVPTVSPSISPTPTATLPAASSSPVASPTADAPKTSASPSPSSSPTSNPSPTENSASPSPNSSPTTSQASPSPTISAAKSAPTPASSPVKSAPPPATSQAAELINQADRNREAGQYQKAIALYDKAIAINPNAAEAHWGRCYSLNSVQQPEDAIAACNQALALKPNYPEALWSKGAALEQQQNPIEALKQYQKATALKPDFPEAWNNEGVALLKLNRPTEALTALEKATTLKPQFANAWANRGAALWKLGRREQAIASMEKAIQINPNDPDIVNLRQQIREKLGR